MATSSASLLPDNSTATNFRAWAQFIHNALITAGWTVTADTGQINLTTVAAPVGANASQGYEIWQTNDGVSPTIYLKLEYGSGPSINFPAIWVTIGTGTNGSGTISGQVTTRKQIAAQSSSAVSTGACIAAGGTGWFTLAMFNTTSITICLVIERIKTSTGGESTLGAVIAGYGSITGVCFSQVLLASGTVPGPVSLVGTVVANSTKVIGTVIGLWPWIPYSQQVVYPNALCMGLVFTGDISTNTTFSCTRYGSSHTYYCVAGATAIDSAVNQWTTAIRYE